jgi:hypothetical protein
MAVSKKNNGSIGKILPLMDKKKPGFWPGIVQSSD